MLLAEVGVRCDKCGTSFVSRQLPTFIDIGYRNSELRQDYRGYNPMMEQYAIVTCPSCGRADWSTEFPPALGKPVLAQVASSAHMQYRQAALERERSQGSINSYQAAVFYIHAAWCADDSKAFPQAREYRRLAAESYKRSLSDNTCPQEARAETEYLIGELMRRSGDFEGARDHFRMCIGRLSARFAVMARKLMRLCEQGSAESIQFEADGLPAQQAQASTAAVLGAPAMKASAPFTPPAAPPPSLQRGNSLSAPAAPPPGPAGSSPGNKKGPSGEQTGGPPGAPPGGPPGFGGKKGPPPGPPTAPPPGAPPLA